MEENLIGRQNVIFLKATSEFCLSEAMSILLTLILI